MTTIKECATKQSDSVESTPDGIGQHEPGAKLDKGKNRMGLVLGGFARALEAVCRVGTDGAEEYTDNGWLSVKDGVARYSDAMLRHNFDKVLKGPYDSKSGSLHSAHRAWNALAALELELIEIEKEGKGNG